MTTPDLAVRYLEVADVPIVGQLVRGSFAERLLPYMVATQPGWERFLEVVLTHPQQFAAQRLAVAERAGEVVGFVDYRVPGDGTGFLSYICVAPQAQGQGVARHLFGEVVSRSGPVQSMGLDVFEDNTPARRMYRSLGFSQVAEQTWWTAPIGDPEVKPAQLDGLPAALASLETYGFCELRGDLGGRGFRCGRMGSQVLRCFSATDFDDTSLSGTLAKTFPELGEVFAVLPGSVDPQRPDKRAINRSIRMTSDDVSALVAER